MSNGIEQTLKLASIDLKAKKYKEAEDKFTECLKTTNSSLAWLGVAACKLGTFTSIGGGSYEEFELCIQQALSVNDISKEEQENEFIKYIENPIILLYRVHNGRLIQKQIDAEFDNNKIYKAVSFLSDTLRKGEEVQFKRELAKGNPYAILKDIRDKVGAASNEKTTHNYTLEEIDEIKNNFLSLLNNHFSIDFNNKIKDIIKEEEKRDKALSEKRKEEERVKSENSFVNKTIKSAQSNWYDKLSSGQVILLIIFFMPVGLYAYIKRKK